MSARIDHFASPAAVGGDAGTDEVNVWIVGVVFTGHALLADGPAPHDGEFPGFADQLTAIGENLLTLPGRTRVLPGHGPETTVEAAEKKFDTWVSAGPVRSGSGD